MLGSIFWLRPFLLCGNLFTVFLEKSNLIFGPVFTLILSSCNVYLPTLQKSGQQKTRLYLYIDDDDDDDIDGDYDAARTGCKAFQPPLVEPFMPSGFSITKKVT